MIELEPRLKAALGDRYTIERELGRGGMAVVYLATDHKLDRQVALKVLRPELAESLGAERLRREIAIAARLSHPNILTLHDCGGDEPCLYYTMQYVEGETLRDRLKREKQLPVEDAVQIAKDVAAALSHAHEQGIVHRDIKPENILFHGGHAVVADFGIAKAVSEVGGESLTETGIAVGTPAYMSPEQAAGERDLDGRTDLYALGCVLYEMLAGEPPFTGPTVESLVRQHLAAEPPRVSVVRPTVPAAIEATVTKALAKAPADRITTAAQFLDALLAADDTGVQPAPRPIAVTRRSVVWIALAVALVGGGIATWQLVGSDGSATPLRRNVIVVAPIRNASGESELDQVASYAASSMAGQLSRVAGWEIHAPDALSAPTASELAGDPRVLAQVFGAGMVLTGRLYAFPPSDSLLFEVTLFDGEDGRQLGQIPVGAARPRATAVVSELAERVIALLAVELEPGLGDLAGTEPTSYEAFRLLRDARRTHASDPTGLAAQRRASELAYQAFLADTGYVTALWWAVIWGYDSLRTALEERTAQLPEAYRLVYEAGIVRVRDRDLERSYQLTRRAHEADPTFFVAANNRMVEAINTNRPRAVLETWNTLSVVLQSQEVRDWWPVWLHRGTAYHWLGDHAEELTVAREAGGRFPPHVAVAALEARALAALGRVEELDGFLDRHVAIGSDGSALGLGYLMHEAGIELYAHGFVEAGEELLGRAAAWFEDRGPLTDDALHYRWRRAETLYAAGDWERAREAFDEFAVRHPDRLPIAGSDEIGALRTYRALLAIHLERADPSDTESWLIAHPSRGYHTWQRARLAAAMGEREEAVTLLGQAFREGSSAVYRRRHADRDLLSLRGFPPYEAFMQPRN